MLTVTNAIFLALFSSSIFHLIPEEKWRLRLWLVAGVSFVIVFSYYPLAALVAVASSIYSWGILVIARKNRLIRKYGPFSILFVLTAFSFQEFHVATDAYSSTLIQFGMSFYVLRLYLVMRTAISGKQEISIEEMLVIALFFPIFPAGPICAQEAFRNNQYTGQSLLVIYLSGFLRIGMGITALYLFTGLISEAIAYLAVLAPDSNILWQEMNTLSVFAVMWLNFLKLYASFAGYTEIAIGLGLFYGFKIPENFRYPFLATNIQNFWQRWHLSLSKFITNQIYLPLMLSLRKPRLAIFLAFVLVGFWHNINAQYFVWGVGHGLALVTYMTFSKRKAYIQLTSRLNRRVHITLSWALTMSLVSFLSTFANEASFEEALIFASSLIPLN